MNNRRIQQVIFALFIALFFVSAPLVVLYTAGYRWSPQQGVIRTGTLFVATTPKNATVNLGGKPYKDKTPTIIKTLKPAEYLIELALPGHLSWEKRLSIKEGETTFIDNVILFLDTNPQLVIQEDMQTIAWSATGAHVAWADHQAGWTEVWISTLAKPASRLVYRVERDEHLALSWIDSETLEIKQTAGNHYVTSTGQLVSQVSHTRVTFQKNTDSVDLLVNGTVLARLPFGTYTVLDERGPYILVQDTAHHRISLLTTADTQQPLLLQEDALFVDWVRQDALAFATEFSISIYEPARHQTTLITRISERIHNVIWHPDGGYLFYATDTELRAIELDDRDNRRVTTLVTMKHIYTFFAHPQGNILYFVGNDGIDTGLYQRLLFKK
ncbi:hypothetical protein COV06_03880 [Candidatus Uhrbacteria bacterium CG10_big_fil_rev_8_21_14_0_10_50_16]|uniref:PEGA domain-containing protein n=1 Tax=Candidatus Uhrbacteria bacterium CG10_big_fil_rev_8_21_14_0_10_50_16 TaxID=1975039 RepID=A0A2H0RLH3_9BACT|nr:MAG: hypothetical protein COV06_03880 [Candidatus Uhrbacteria bacterium CG10_big_fil_rev_8_21_14_0_10_50_16]